MALTPVSAWFLLRGFGWVLATVRVHRALSPTRGALRSLSPSGVTTSLVTLKALSSTLPEDG